jgi:2'-5' RNA ligase
VPEENLHLTLAFLGDVSEAVARDLDEILSRRPCLPHRSFRRARHLRRDGTRPRLRGGAPRPGLAALQSKVARARAWRGPTCRVDGSGPHVTLTRANRQPVGPARDRLAAALGLPVDIPAFDATELVLFQLHARTPDGARHDPLARYPLSPFPPEPPRDQVDEPLPRRGQGRSPATGRGVRQEMPRRAQPGQKLFGRLGGRPREAGRQGQQAVGPVPGAGTRHRAARAGRDVDQILRRSRDRAISEATGRTPSRSTAPVPSPDRRPPNAPPPARPEARGSGHRARGRAPVPAGRRTGARRPRQDPQAQDGRP